ncbi:MAG: carboxylating nicotinate-nucleotide diphosphorylase [bacterium]
MSTASNPRIRRDWNALPLPDLFEALAFADAERAVSVALVEDLGAEAALTAASSAFADVTSRATIAQDDRGRARIESRAEGVLCGVRVAEIVARRAGLAFTAHREDGARLVRGTRVATVEGPLASLLAHERTMLNFLTLLSGNATMAAHFVEETRGTRAAICDTRKTIPGLRTLQKYATRCGGAMLHRIGLFDAMLLKDNHLGSFGGDDLATRVHAAAVRAREQGEIAFVECEVDSLEQFDAVLSLALPGPDRVLDMILLDNMDPAMLAEAVRRRDARGAAVLLEASGGVRLDTVRRIALSGVDRISVGAITHSAPALDLGLDIEIDRGATSTQS